MADILEKIASQTLEDLKKRKREISFRDLESLKGYEKDRLNFAEALRSDSVSIIAEVKKASPSKGVIRADFDALKIADAYIENGASAISILTDEPFFRGSLKYLEQVSDISSIPLLRKDFIIDPYQVKEAKAYGADAILLIVTMYEGNQLTELIAAANEFGVQPLVECYEQEEVENLDWDEVQILGVNNRDLKKFEVDLHRGIELLEMAPDQVVTVSESGIHKPEDLMKLYKHNIHSALIGEHFMRQTDIGDGLKRFIDEFEELKAKSSYTEEEA
ncbi:MAG: indole-3-glycerol phosphate synthase TrpC [Balneolaceae bacterium]|nr:indole-3-glycerol phosphate synthase TrpC [Balneolaceae bacterium]MDR9408677.1 indole-3-glycerol phosphate synthase TrpC [Balneolaceae bacterium]